MLRILGSGKNLCDGLTRRDMLWAGGLGTFGLGLGDFFHLQEAQGGETSSLQGFGRAKSCILLYLYGAPSQLETFDLKPDAPEEIRGELKPIRSTLPECDVCELLPRVAKIMNRATVVRSLTHPYPIHGVAFATTGTPTIDIPMELSPRDGRHWPFIGSVVDHILSKQSNRRVTAPDNIALPFPFSSMRKGEVPRAGPYSGFLSSAHDPIWTQFKGKATRSVVKTLQDKYENVMEPYIGVSDDTHFTLGDSARLRDGLTLDRLNQRESLVAQFDRGRASLDRAAAHAGFDKQRERALSLITSEKARTALDLRCEDPKVRDSYGMTLFGQAALAARRLVEAGSRFVTVFWDEYGLAGSGWDTHWDHYPRMKNELLPGFDGAFSGLIADLDQRGMLDETLVLVLSEHGRTPTIQNVKGGGRDHWSRCYSSVAAGGGIARGRVVGKSDRIAGDVLERPVSPKDLLATAYHLLGIDPHTLIVDRLGRPLPLVQDGRVVPEMLA